MDSAHGLFMLSRANAEFIASYRWEALTDGALHNWLSCWSPLVHDVLSVPHLVDSTDGESDAVTTPEPASESPEAKR